MCQQLVVDTYGSRSGRLWYGGACPSRARRRASPPRGVRARASSPRASILPPILQKPGKLVLLVLKLESSRGAQACKILTGRQFSYITLIFIGDCLTAREIKTSLTKCRQNFTCLGQPLARSGRAGKTQRGRGVARAYLETDGRARGGRERSSRVRTSISRVGGPPPPSRPARDPLAVRLGPELNL